MEYLQSFLDYEANFDGQSWINFHQEHGDIPIIVVSVYLGLIFYLPDHIAKPIKMRKFFAVWNFLLCAFSIIGASRVVPVLYTNLRDKGFHYTVCTDPEQWYLKGGCGFWTALFIYSKIPELLDTLFLVLQKKNVIFLHWFHHCTVLLYCWHAFHFRIAPGLWFASMNFCVHSVMYAYYFLCIIGFRSFARPIAPLITAVQVLQMVGGIIVTVTSAYTHYYSGPAACFVTGSNYRLGLMMYTTYFVLFVVLFYNLYIGKKRAVAVGCPPKAEDGVGCPQLPNDGKVEAAGRFFFEQNGVQVLETKGKIKRTRSNQNLHSHLD